MFLHLIRQYTSPKVVRRSISGKVHVIGCPQVPDETEKISKLPCRRGDNEMDEFSSLREQMLQILPKVISLQHHDRICYRSLSLRLSVPHGTQRFHM